MKNRSSSRPRVSPRQFALIGKALADPRRVALLEAIAAEGDECACARIREQFPVSKATISHHVKELVRAGLIDAHRDGQFLHCEVRRDVLAAYTEELLRRTRRRAPGAAAG